MSLPHKNGKDGATAVVDPAVSRESTLLQLSKVLDSSHFRSSKRCSQFLRYVIEQASEHHLDGLKERTLGIAVFDRDPDYDTNQDPVVRGTAGEVRKRLAQYYLEPGHEAELRISLPPGSYIPEIHPAPIPEKVEAVAIPPSRFQRIAIVAAGLALVVAAAMFGLSFRKTDLDRFWSPVLETQHTVLVCLGQPKTYNFNTKTQAELDNWFEGPPEGKDVPEATPLSEIVPMWDRYISIDDAKAFSRISNLFAEKGKRAELRGGRSVSLTDLRGKPVVLIGAFNNEWTMSLAGELRFYFDVDHVNGGELVRDRQRPDNTYWKVVKSWPHLRIPQDYAIVSRVYNPTTEQTVVISAGITHYGTSAAAEFLTNPAYFAEALKSAPRDWSRKNMQVVLSVKVISGTAGPPNVLATHFW